MRENEVRAPMQRGRRPVVPGAVSGPVMMPVLTVVLGLIWLGALLGGGPTSPYDIPVQDALYLGPDAPSAGIWVFLTHLGGWQVLTAAAVVGGVLLYRARRMRDLAFLAATVISVRAMVELQKLLFARARPDDLHLADVSSHAFPSGHAANGLATWLTLALLLSGRPIAMAAAVLLALLIGLSRVLLGVHWPSDVIGGWAFALVWMLLLARVVQARE